MRPKQRRVIWRELADGWYRELAPEADGRFRSRVFPGLWLDPEFLFNGDLGRVAAAVQQGVATAEHARFVARLAR